MKEKLKQERGISLITLTVAVIIIMIITGMLIYSSKDSIYIKNLTNMQNDISNLRDKISEYYTQYGALPATKKYTNISHLSGVRGANDTGDFYVIDLTVIDNLTLNYGQDYEKIKNLDDQATIDSYADLYIINNNSHNIFYVKGVNYQINGEMKKYYTDKNDLDKEKVELRYVEGVKIPEGFYYCGGTKEEGIVISDVLGDDLSNSKQGNQFVWVPVEDFDEFVREDFGTQNIPDEDFINTEPTEGKYYEPGGSGQDEGTEVECMYKSVKEYKGFYIARYEAGTTATSGTGIRGEVVSKKGANVYNNIAWGNSTDDETGGAVEVARSMYTKDNTEYGVTSTLCYGVQWDAVMRWINKDENLKSYLENSGEKGNYSTDNILKPGEVESHQMKNIYDMAGNVWEWTMEASGTTRRVYRGGSCQGYYPVTSRNYTSYAPNNTDLHFSFRVALYIDPKEEVWSVTYDKEAIYTDENGEKAYIPKNFQVSTSPYCNKISNGLVVREASTGDEYVWIDVPKSIYTNPEYTAQNNNTEVISETDYTGIYNILNAYCYTYREGAKGQGYYWQDEWFDGNGNTKDTSSNLEDTTGCGLTYEQYTKNYQNMLTSIYLNGGFYIGRYEAGIAGTTGEIVDGDTTITNLVRTETSARITNVSPKAISQKDAIPYNYIYCSEAQTLASNMAQDSGRTSSLPFGIQWDLVCKFLQVRSTLSEEDINVDSGDWGNYSNREFSILKGKCLSYRDDGWVMLEGERIKEISKQDFFSTGILEFAKCMNIYDLAGNAFESTLEYGESYHISYRGGNFGTYTSNTYPVSSRYNIGQNKAAILSGSFRPVIY